MFRIGQRVVCVDTTCRGMTGRPVSYWIKEGSIYTIRWIGHWECPFYPGGICVRLEEIERPSEHWGDCPFYADRFRPLVEKKTDISVFKALLNPVQEKENV